MRRVLSIAATLVSIFLLTSPVWACQVYRDVIQDTQGNVLSGVTVTAYVSGTSTLATLYSEKTCTSVRSNPFTNSSNGQIVFYGKNGRYTVITSKAGVTLESTVDTVLTDPTEALSGPLTVPGLIWSTVGGFKFPDNTIQLTAGGGGGGGGVTSVTGTSPIVSSGGTTPIISLADTAVAIGSYTYSSITVDQKGRLTAASSGSAPVLPTRSINTTSPLDGGGDLSTDRTLTCTTCVTTVTASGNLSSSGGTTPAITLTGSPSFTTVTLTGTTLTSNGHTVTFPATSTSTAIDKTCAGTDKVSAYVGGTFTCSADQTAGGGAGIVTLNGETGATQSFSVGTTGTDFAIVSATNNHAFNLPTATGSVRGALASADWTTFNNKQATIAVTSPITLGSNVIGCATCVTAVTASGNLSSSGGTTPAITVTTTPTFSTLVLNGTSTYGIDANGGTFTNSLRSANLDYLVWRNGAGSADVNALRVNSSNEIELGNSAFNAFTLSSSGTPSYKFAQIQVSPGTVQAACFDVSGFLYRSGTAGCPGTGGGITSLNGLTGTTQAFVVGTSGTDFGIVSSGTVHTFNIPDVSGSARGLVTIGTQTIAGAKTFDSLTLNSSSGAPQFIGTSKSQLVQLRTAGWSAPSIDVDDYAKTVFHLAHGSPSGIPGSCTNCIGLTATVPATELDTVHFSRYDKTPSGSHTATLTADLFADSASGNSSQSAANFVAINYRTNASFVVGSVNVAAPATTSATTSITVATTSQAGSGSAIVHQKSMGHYVSTTGLASPDSYNRNDWVTGTNTTDAALGVLIANASQVRSATAGLVIAGVDPLTSGGLAFKNGIVIEDFTIAGLVLPSKYDTINQGTALTLPLAAGTFTGSQRLTYNVTSGGTLWGNAIVGEQKNNAAASTTIFPAGVVAYGTVLNTGNQTFGLFARADLPVSTGVATNEVNSFNVTVGDATTAYPPDRSIGTTQRLPIALTVASGGSFKSAIGIHIAKEGSAPQQFRTGIYMNPDAIADYGLFIDADASNGAGTLGALVKSKASVIPLQFQTVGTVVSANAMMLAVANGTNVFAIKQGGYFCMMDQSSQFRTVQITGGGAWSIGGAGSC